MRWSTENAVPSSKNPIALPDPGRARNLARSVRDSGQFASVSAGPAAQRHDEPTSSWAPRELWFHLVQGELHLAKHFTADDKVYLVAESRQPQEVERARLTERELAVLCRLLVGDSQKAAAYDLGLCPSTVATHAARAFDKLNLPLSASSVPLALVLIGQAACGAIELPDVRITTSLRQGQRYVVANVSRPSENHLTKLTTAERAVALALVDGLSKLDIARARCTSVHTIGRQVSSLFAKLNVKGRFDLICRMSQ